MKDLSFPLSIKLSNNTLQLGRPVYCLGIVVLNYESENYYFFSADKSNVHGVTRREYNLW